MINFKLICMMNKWFYGPMTLVSAAPAFREGMGVGKTAMLSWVHQLNSECGGVAPDVGIALTPDQQRIQALEAQNTIRDN